jgi:adenylate cyclase
MDVLGREPYAMRWPFPRTAFAALVVALHQAGAQQIVLDFTFFDQSEAAEQDVLLAGIAAAIPSVTLARTKDQLPAFWDTSYQAVHPLFFRATRMGNADLSSDSDGVVRSYSSIDSLAAAAMTSTPQRTSGLIRWYGGLEQIRSRGVPVLAAFPFIAAGLPILRHLSDAMPYGDPKAIFDMLENEKPLHGELADRVRGRTIFIGANVRGTFDRTPFPVGELEPGVLLHWSAWGNLMSGGFVHALPRTLSLVVAGLAALAVFATGQQRTSLAAPGAIALGLTLLFLGGAYLAVEAGQFFAPSTPTVASILTLLAVAADSFWTEQKRKREIQGMFSSYVAPEVVELLMRDPKAIQLGGERRDATVLFSDLVGFTELSETLRPDALLSTVNAYLHVMSSCMLQHGAYIDKYIGDAIMAVFGVPLPVSNDALAACHAALAAQAALVRLNESNANRGLPELQMRTGINTGSMIVGNLGCDRKKNYTVLGDSVNLASRLEAANKEFGTWILLGPQTAAMVSHQLAIRPLTRLQVKGKKEAVEVYELVGHKESLSVKAQEALALYCDGYAALSKHGFAEAEALLRRSAALQPDNHVTCSLLKQASSFCAHPPGPDWAPLTRLTTK